MVSFYSLSMGTPLTNQLILGLGSPLTRQVRMPVSLGARIRFLGALTQKGAAVDDTRRSENFDRLMKEEPPLLYVVEYLGMQKYLYLCKCMIKMCRLKWKWTTFPTQQGFQMVLLLPLSQMEPDCFPLSSVPSNYQQFAQLLWLL